MAPVVRYPPEYFGSGAAGFRHVSTLLNDLALAASSIQAALPSAKPLPLRGSDGRTLPTTRRRGAPTPYSAMRDSRGYSSWRAVIVCLSVARMCCWLIVFAKNNIPSPSKERITTVYLGCCDAINVSDWSTLRKHQFSACHANYLKDEDLQYIPIGLCPACPEDLGCRDEYVEN